MWSGSKVFFRFFTSKKYFGYLTYKRIQLSLELQSSAVASPCTLRLVAEAAAAALIWRFSFEIIRSEKSPTAVSSQNKDADTVENIQGVFFHWASP